MKYICFEDQAGHAVPIVFPDRIGHAEMREQMPYGVVLGAGYVELDDCREGPASTPRAPLPERRLRCHGDAPELGVKARPEDAAAIAAAFGRES